MHRFYVANQNLNQKNFKLTDPDEVHHLKTVLRLKADSKIELFNTQSQIASATIKSIKPNCIELIITSVKETLRKGPDIILCCAIPKKGKFEVIIEKTTELGVSEIYPLQTKRTEVILNADKASRKLERYKTVALNASKQSKRAKVPLINPVQSFKDVVLKLHKTTTLIIPSLEHTTKPIIEVLSTIPKDKPIAFFIGPEGDFTPQEYALAREQKAFAVSLGPNILRVETAAISAIAAANFIINT